MPTAIYVHIPFCEHICHYCDFNKVFLQGQPVDEYVQALDIELADAADKYFTEPIQTIYIGGGTPTALSAKQLEKVLASLHKHFTLNDSLKEWTVEVNPGGVTDDQLNVLRDYGVNRLSIGVQTFDPFLLKKIGRTHQPEDIYKTIERARQKGFNNLTVDLMFGLPEQTMEAFDATLKKAFSLEIEHFSAYSLKVEEKTVFYNLLRKGKLPLPTEDEEALMYERLIEQMNKHGYHQYEISNFAKSGYESKHNIIYWNNEEYFGIGAGAHGYINGVRYANIGPVQKYIQSISEKKQARFEANELSEKERMEEEMFMGLRMLDGVSKQKFYERYGIQLTEMYQKQIEQLAASQLIQVTPDRVKLTRKGVFLANEVFEQFLVVE
ncbi:radical SAM family heme chaperone HemW [Alkalihalobacterium chitinilyticum]|uniref:Heme chaperone HemW n=1 Tax=Alkalihalobacterium chitinilyticum TaxID=2980103 RepID=A0ABT5VEG6_9BACI|nr:radical SAM family heme chaperone HemW [Alkalihalobacterium chitinilyticum]MDE5413860.1 radical SAM family heme chaperone HemW [Alkalihalobacterium chitinilyticum]